jgi:hypothetical protein
MEGAKSVERVTWSNDTSVYYLVVLIDGRPEAFTLPTVSGDRTTLLLGVLILRLLTIKALSDNPTLTTEEEVLSAVSSLIEEVIPKLKSVGLQHLDPFGSVRVPLDDLVLHLRDTAKGNAGRQRVIFRP